MRPGTTRGILCKRVVENARVVKVQSMFAELSVVVDVVVLGSRVVEGRRCASTYANLCVTVP
jgi:hypothetical protein